MNGPKASRFLPKHSVEYTPEKAEKITGVPARQIIEAARLYGKAERPAIYYTMA